MKRSQRSKPQTVKVGNVMVRIYKRTRRHSTGKIYVSHYVEDRTTGIRRWRIFADPAEARKEAERIARQISSGNVAAATMNNADAASYGRAVELLRPLGIPLELGAAILAKAVGIVGNAEKIIEAATFYARHRADQITSKPIADVILELIAAKEARKKSERYIGDLRYRLSRFAASFGADASIITAPHRKGADGKDTRNRGVDISTITTPDVQRFLDGLNVSPQTAKNFRTVLGTLFSFAESRGYIFKGGNPVEATESITVNGSAIQIFTPDEITKLLNAATPEFLPFLVIGAFAGLRSAEIQRIEWRDVDLAGGFIHVGGDKAKTRSRRLVPILPNLAAWLAPYADKQGKVWKGTTNDLQDARAKLVKASGVAWKDNGLRHSFISYRLADAQNVAQVALEAGNSPAMVFKHYRELVKPAEAKAWFGVSPEQPANVVAMKGANP